MKTETKPNITEEELAVLRKLVDSGKLKSKFALRLLAILNRASGKTLESIADFLSLSLSAEYGGAVVWGDNEQKDTAGELGEC
jgi:hypothetical protein